MNKNNTIFKKRRKKFQKRMHADSISIFLAPPVRNRNSDVDYRYRQSSDFYYLTGLQEEQSALIIDKENVYLFLRKRDREMETWNGYRMGLKRAPWETGIKKVFGIDQFFERLPTYLKNKHYVYYKSGVEPLYDNQVIPLIYQLHSKSRKKDFGPHTMIQPSRILNNMRLFKDKSEIALLKESAVITKKAHLAAISKSKPGMYAYEVEAEIQRAFRKHNAWEAYPSIVAPGQEACILHYIQNDVQIKRKDLILVDAGAEYKFLATDVTRTFPAAKKFPSPARDLYRVVLEAQEKAISACHRGNTLQNIHELTIKNLTQGLMDLKILGKDLDKNLEKESWKDFYMHNTSHWLGMDVHDVGDYYTPKQKPRKLESGMVFTVEPGLYISALNRKAPKHFRGIGIRIEDNILITNEKTINLTQDIPKSIKDLENLKAI